jgi:hypothetical protein
MSTEDRIQAGERSVDRFAMAAGAIFGAWLARAMFSGSATALGLGAVVGLFIVSPVAGQMARSTAGGIVGASGLREYHPDEDNVDIGPRERRIVKGQRVAKILLISVIVASGLGSHESPHFFVPSLA